MQLESNSSLWAQGVTFFFLFFFPHCFFLLLLIFPSSEIFPSGLSFFLISSAVAVRLLDWNSLFLVLGQFVSPTGLIA
ncbi:hypothetical protein F4778DRAFT_363815 [Xylariomycetidae sp. FL2044]|nr:hypothetical protein F4778DRAFT_363815 [Xylariomycetidae sp. FL2044]